MFKKKPFDSIRSVLNFLVLSPVQQNYQVDFFNVGGYKYLELIVENTNHIILFTEVDDDNELFRKYFLKKAQSSKGGWHMYYLTVTEVNLFMRAVLSISLVQTREYLYTVIYKQLGLRTAKMNILIKPTKHGGVIYIYLRSHINVLWAVSLTKPMQKRFAYFLQKVDNTQKDS